MQSGNESHWSGYISYGCPVKSQQYGLKCVNSWVCKQQGVYVSTLNQDTGTGAGPVTFKM